MLVCVGYRDVRCVMVSKVYVMVDAAKRIIRCEGGITTPDDLTGWLQIDEGTGDKYDLCQSYYFDGGLFTKDTPYVPRYKLVDGVPVLRSEEEIEADILPSLHAAKHAEISAASEAAIYAGLEAATGDYAAVMDVDLQDPPSLLPDMLKAIEKEGYDCAGTRRVTRQGEPLLRSFFARAFYKTIHQISNTRIVDGARDYKLMTRPVLEALLSLKEYNRFSKGLYEWVGFRTKWFEYENVERVAGETKWSFFKLFLYSIEGIVAFSTAPLALASIMGVLLSFISFLSIIILTVRELIWPHSAYGWTSLVCVFCMMGGIVLLCLGILGQYLAKTYTEVKKRPIYIARERSIKPFN